MTTFNPFNPLEHPICWATPDWLAPTAWADCLPFGMFLIDVLRPRTIVELGGSRGVSYCGFCQAVATLGLESRAVAVADPLDIELRNHHDARYGGFSQLLQSTFEQTRGLFSAATVDLLHIDGVADYQHVARTIDLWLPAMSDRGVVLLHDTSIRSGEVGVCRLWETLRRRYPSLELPHGKGLGLVAVGQTIPSAVHSLIAAPEAERRVVERFFCGLGRLVQKQVDAASSSRHADVQRLTQILQERDEGIAWLQEELSQAARGRDRLQALNASLTDQLHEILSSRAWRWLMRSRRGVERYRPRRPAPASRPVPELERPEPIQHPLSHAEDASGSLRSLTLLPELSAGEAMTLVARRAAKDDEDTGLRPDVICFSIIDWEFRYQRPQQIMSQFAAHGHRVFYVSASRFLAGPPDRPPAVRLIADNIYEVQLASPRPPDVYGEVIDGAGGVLDSLAALRRAHDISSALAYVMIASWTDVALETGRRWGWTVAYDCMDEWENFAGIKPPVVAAETRLASRCDLLIVSADRLQRKWAARGRQGVLVRNGVDYGFYSGRCRPNSLLSGVAHPVVGYFGAIADWFDVELLAHVARERPSCHFVLLGGVFNVDVRTLEVLPNVSLLGQQPYSTMPQYLYHFDVCLIPFKVNPITEATDPVKLYEYLSAGKPVVATALPELESCRDHVYLASDREDFLAQLDRAVAEGDPERTRRRRQFAAEHTWADRYRRIRAALADATAPVTIVIVTYNNVQITELCLESVLRNTAHGRYDVIVVDNGSTDGTPTYLRHMMAQHPQVKAILNADNRGFAKANNQGLAQSTGRHLVLLNNDTIVPPAWLARLLRPLRDPEIGLVGPLTNFVGNEARVEVAYRTWGEMEAFASACAWRRDAEVADIHMLAMFCVAMRRDTYDRVGPLDERFGLGMFEDDDYAHRMRAAGYRVVCAGDVFVHHVGQAAFKQLIARGEYDALFARNRRAYEAKWNLAWQRHEHGTLQFKPAGIDMSARV